MGSGFRIVKFAFFIFNVLFWLLGCATLGVGIWLHLSRAGYGAIAPSYTFLSAPALCIAAGIIVLVVGFFGCCGAIMENQCMLLTYFVLVVLIFLIEMVAGILAFVHKDEVERVIEKELLTGIQSKYPGEHNEMKDVWDQVQTEFQCCGVNNYSDWYNIKEWEGKDYVPDSCCKEQITNCGKTLQTANWNTANCLGELKYWLTQNLYILGVLGITVGVIQILGMVAAMVLYCCLRQKKYNY